ncbi:uncharacterized protein LOC122075339 [Macadamia integrifolia]|uniref:uncharacterized protein LOC122075339 n=1 Tax=Macadamia integrifolia TaxID=60698 RepID=UPI001C4ECC47|nr:uncharacterized protein LOC122075339 [Macadamia integrifolia]
MMEDYETEEKKQAAADVLFQYSKFVMVCIGEGVRPSDLRLHLMKEISGMQTSLKRETSQTTASPNAISEPSSSGTRGDRVDGGSHALLGRLDWDCGSDKLAYDHYAMTACHQIYLPVCILPG